MVGSADDDPDVKALTIALVNGRIVDTTIRSAYFSFPRHLAAYHLYRVFICRATILYWYNWFEGKGASHF